jgi:hypothetical protein
MGKAPWQGCTGLKKRANQGRDLSSGGESRNTNHINDLGGLLGTCTNRFDGDPVTYDSRYGENYRVALTQ